MDGNCPTEADSHTVIRTSLNYRQPCRIRPVLSSINRIFFHRCYRRSPHNDAGRRKNK